MFCSDLIAASNLLIVTNKMINNVFNFNYKCKYKIKLNICFLIDH